MITKYSCLKRLICCLVLLFVFKVSTKAQASKDMVIAQMNYCINALTNIINAPSIYVYTHERDMLLNNLTIQHIVGLEDVVNFRRELLECVSELEITEEERNIMKRSRQMKKGSQKWRSFSNALSAPMMLIPSLVTGVKGSSKVELVQVAFYSLLTIARTAVDYTTSQYEAETEELQSLWELKKRDLNVYAHLRAKALDLIYKLYEKYNLKENDRLTEKSLTRFNNIISEKDASARIRLLQDNKTEFGHLMEYYYYLGMAYLDDKEYEKAKPFFDTYLSMYSKTPIFRNDEKSGCIALAKLTFDENLTSYQVKNLINLVETNLPNNGAAVLQCAYSYLYYMKDINKTGIILRKGIDNNELSDKDALIMAASKLMPEINKNPELYEQIIKAVLNAKNISIDNFIGFISSLNIKDYWDYISKLFSFDNFSGEGLWGSSYLRDDFTFKVPDKYIFNIENANIYTITIEKESTDVVTNKRTQSFKYGIKKTTILDKIDCFRGKLDLINYFFSPLIDNKLYKVRSNIEFDRFLNNDLLYSLCQDIKSRFTLTDDDRKDIVDFCKGKLTENPDYHIIETSNNDEFFPDKTMNKVAYIDNLLDSSKKFNVVDVNRFSSNKDYDYCFNHTLIGEKNAIFTPMLFANQMAGDYLCVDFPNTGVSLSFYYNSEKKSLDLYSVLSNKKIYYSHFQEPFRIEDYADLVVDIVNTAVAALKAGKLGEAEKSFKEALKYGYKDVRIYAMLSKVLKDQDKEKEAETYLQKGYELFPNDTYMLIELINYYLFGKEPKKAEVYLDAAIKQDPKNELFYRAKGTLYEKIKQPAKAEEMYVKVLELNPNDFLSLYNLGNIKLSLVVNLHIKASNISDQNECHRAMEEVFEGYESVIPYFERALESSPGEKNTVAILKDLYFKLRKKDAKYQVAYDAMCRLFNV